MGIKVFIEPKADTVSVEKSRKTILIILAFIAAKLFRTNIVLTISFVLWNVVQSTHGNRFLFLALSKEWVEILRDTLKNQEVINAKNADNPAIITVNP